MEVLPRVVSAALATCGVESACFFAASSCRNDSICCCVLAMASSRLLICFEIWLSSLFVLLVVLWPKTRLETSSKKHSRRNNFIHLLHACRSITAIENAFCLCCV